MTTLDLDARRKEYAEETHEVTLGGESYQLPPKFPLVVAQYLQQGRIDLAVEVLFGTDNVSTVVPLLNDDDINQILTYVYDLEPPEAATPAVKATNGQGRTKARAR